MTTDTTDQPTEPQSRWVSRDASGITWLSENEPTDFNGRLWDLGSGIAQWTHPELWNLEPGTKSRLLLAPVVSATGASTSGLNESGQCSPMATECL